MKKWLVSLFVFLIILTAHNAKSFAQMGLSPEFLGNAAGAPDPGFALKFFTSYFNQSAISANDAEIAFEPQFFIPGFSGDYHKDQIQFIAHLPIGYRSENNSFGNGSSVFGIGSLGVNVEHFWHIINEEDFEFWFDNGITSGYPTATKNKGVRIGGNNFSVGWFQENFIRYKKMILTIMPVGLNWGFRDDFTKDRPGLSMNIMNGGIGYTVSKYATIGVDFGLMLGSVTGSEDVNGNRLDQTLRAYVGPAGLFPFTERTSLQLATIIDVKTIKTRRGQGVFLALWHHF